MATQQSTSSKREQAKHLYLESLPKTISRLSETWHHLRHIQWDPKGLQIIRQNSHKLFGGAATLGLKELTQALKTLDRLVSELEQTNTVPNQLDSNAIEASLKEIRLQLQNEVQSTQQMPVANEVVTLAQSSEPEKQDAPKPQQDSLIYLVDDDQVIRNVLGEQLENAGFRVKTFATLPDLFNQLKSESPSLLILDIIFPEDGPLAGIEALYNLRLKTGLKVPVIFISARSDMIVRLRCLRAGGNGFFAKPVEINSLLQKIEELTPVDERQYRALLIDDDPVSLEIHSETLKHANFSVKTIEQPIKALKEINTFKPDILVLDLMMPQCNGIELASILRQDQNFSHLPIIFLSAADPQKIKQLTESIGHSIFLTKPVDSEVLCDLSLKHARQYQFMQANLKEALHERRHHNVLPRYQFIEQLEQLLNHQRQELKQYCLYYIALDRIEAVRTRFGLNQLDQINSKMLGVITPLLKQRDLAAEFSDGVLMLLLHADFEQSLVIANQCIEGLNKIIFAENTPPLLGTSSIGIISLDAVASNCADIITFAEAAANQALKSGGNRAVSVVQKHSQEIEDNNQIVLQDSIESAIKNKNYLLNYQSIVNLADPAFNAYEVLVRLRDGFGRELRPVQFMQVAEQLGQSVELDRWVYTSTLDSISRDQRKLLNATLFLKVSRKTLGFKLLPSIISGLINECRIRGNNRLVFLLSHQDIVDDLKQCVSFAKGIASIQCDLAVEHFSLQLSTEFLKYFTPAFIKLSPKLLRQAMESAEHKAELRSFVNQSKLDKINLIGALIEDRQVIEQCYELGINYFQGYLIQRPAATMQPGVNFELKD